MSCFPRRLLLVASSCLLVSVLGCGFGDGRPARVPVSGIVTLGGNPVEGALVTFVPKSPDGESAVGTTDAGGRYVMTTFEKDDGAVPGEYFVKVAKYEKYEAPVENLQNVEFTEEAYSQGYAAPEEGAVEKGPKNLLPAKFSDPYKSGLDYTVTEGENTHDIQLTK